MEREGARFSEKYFLFLFWGLGRVQRETQNCMDYQEMVTKENGWERNPAAEIRDALL